MYYEYLYFLYLKFSANTFLLLIKGKQQIQDFLEYCNISVLLPKQKIWVNLKHWTTMTLYDCRYDDTWEYFLNHSWEHPESRGWVWQIHFLSNASILEVQSCVFRFSPQTSSYVVTLKGVAHLKESMQSQRKGRTHAEVNLVRWIGQKKTIIKYIWKEKKKNRPVW